MAETKLSSKIYRNSVDEQVCRFVLDATNVLSLCNSYVPKKCVCEGRGRLVPTNSVRGEKRTEGSSQDNQRPTRAFQKKKEAKGCQGTPPTTEFFTHP